MKAFLLLLPGVFIFSVSYAQYTGGSGKGNNTITTSSVSLAAVNTMYSGGSNDGHSGLTVAALSLGTSTQYSGGIDDGSSLVTHLNTSLSAASSYSGGPDDGASSGIGTALSLGLASMYAGGVNDGFNLLSASSLTMGTSSNYSGGPDDGASGILTAAVNLGIANMYAGGSNDGASGIVASAIGMVPTSSMYKGEGNDGYSSFATAAPIAIVALPITWEDFAVTRKGQDAWLDWQVGNDRNDKGFYIERSYEGASFSTIGFVKALNGISTRNEYHYTDAAPALYCPYQECGEVFYRLRQVDLGGHFSFSPVRRLSLDAPSLQASVYPNPTSDKIIIQINAAKGSNLSYNIALYNSIGAAVYVRNMQSQLMNEVDVRAYPSGIYYLRLSIDGRTYPYQITITH